MKKYTYDEVAEYFKSRNCVLISKEYVDCKKKLKYTCSCGNEAEINFDNFKSGKRCSECAKRKIANKLKKSYEEIYNYFKNNGCLLLSKEYLNNSQKLDYICSCGNKSEITFSNFKKGERCIKCSGSEKYTYDEVKKYFESKNCKLLSKKYFKAHGKLDYICSCGNYSKISFSNFKNGSRCKECGLKKVRKTRELKYNQTPLKELNNFEIYKRLVYSLTQKTYKLYIDSINPNDLPRGKGKYHLDHKYSIRNGFRNNILPIVISNRNNLQMLSENENLSKNFKNSITINQLLKNYNEN